MKIDEAKVKRYGNFVFTMFLLACLSVYFLTLVVFNIYLLNSVAVFVSFIIFLLLTQAAGLTHIRNSCVNFLGRSTAAPVFFAQTFLLILYSSIPFVIMVFYGLLSFRFITTIVVLSTLLYVALYGSLNILLYKD